MKNKFLIIFITFLFIFSFNCNVFADALDDYKNQLLQVQEKQKQTASQLQGIDKEIANYLYEITVLDGEVTLVGMKLQELEKKVEEVTKSLKEQEELLQTSSQTYNSLEDVYMTRLRVIYENGMPNMLDILLTSNSLNEFFSKMSILKTIIEYDQSLVTNLKTQKDYVEYAKENIEFKKTQLEQLTYDTEKSKETLENAVAAKGKIIEEMKSSKARLESTAAQLAQQEKETQESIKQEIIKMQNSGSFNGQFYWPAEGFYLITATMGYYDPWGTGARTYHTGTDIAGSGIAGTPIKAMESGQVTLARWYGSYGNCVIIDHGRSVLNGKTYKTLYAHAQSLAVSQGEAVARGQVIAYVGSTGNSTGAHLHLEVYENNTLTSALNYFDQIKFTYY